jgi:PD-(D/E)XK nuclease superfamily
MTIDYVRHSPSALNLFAASPAMFTLERIIGLEQPVGVPAHRGVAVENGVTTGLLNHDASPQECINAAFATYDVRTAMSTDERREKYRATIPDMVKQALTELRAYGVPSETQGYVEWQPQGLKLPIVGYFDYHWVDHNITTDLKTTERMPSQVKVTHARQVSLYVTSNNADPRVTYVTPKKCQTYSVENINEHRKALHQIALRVETFLSLSEDPEFFKSITVPDLESFYWTSPAARQLAFELWKI